MQGTGFEKYEVMRMSRTVTSVSGFQFVEARAFTAWRMQSPCDFSEVVWLCAAHPLSPQVCAGGHLPTTFCAMPPRAPPSGRSPSPDPAAQPRGRLALPGVRVRAGLSLPD